MVLIIPKEHLIQALDKQTCEIQNVRNALPSKEKPCKPYMENPFYTLPPSMEESKSNKIGSHTFSSQSFRNSLETTFVKNRGYPDKINLLIKV